MFPTKRFRSIACPKENCPKPLYCLFNHQKVYHEYKRSISSIKPTESIPKKFQKQELFVKESVRIPINDSVFKEPIVKEPIVKESVRKVPVTKEPITKATGSTPTIKKDINSKIPWQDRQKALEKFYDEFTRLYQHIKTDRISDDAIKQEIAVYQVSTAQTYKQRVVGVLMRLRKRPLAIDDKDVGIDGEWVERKVMVDQPVPLDKLRSMILVDDDWKNLDYPNWDLLEPPTKFKIDQVRECSRCGEKFQVKYPLSQEEEKACFYHFGRVGHSGSERYYTCCRGDSFSKGCTFGPHVYSLESDQECHDLIPFRKLPQSSKGYPILALDCEMSYTTGGMEVVRVSIVDWNGKTVLDTIVEPIYPIICYNTRFSGVSKIEGGITLDALHEMLASIASVDTIFVGHSLCSDLRALRLQHRNVIDTLQVFPHPRGHPFKHALRYLVQTHLGRFIQTGQHNSVEDAIACIDLLKVAISKQ